MGNIINLFLIILCTSPSFALGEGDRNLLLIGLMSLSPIFLYKKIHNLKYECILLIFCSLIILNPLIFHPDSIRWSTMLYSCMFCLFFISFTRIFSKRAYNISKYERILKFILYLYFFVLLIQQFCVLVGLPIFNLNNYDITTPWKLNSMSSEPSHTARFVAVLMYSLLLIQDNIAQRKLSLKESYCQNKYQWLSFLWVMITSISGTAMLLLLVILLRYINRKYFFRSFITAFIVVILFFTIDFKPIERVKNITYATLTLDKDAMIEADHSAALRLVPMIVCVENIDIFSLDGWIGKGVDYASKIMSNEIFGVPEGYTSGGCLLLALEYGLFPFFIIIYFTSSICIHKEQKIQSFILWLFCCFFLGVNSQIAWSYIFLSYINKKLSK